MLFFRTVVRIFSFCRFIRSGHPVIQIFYCFALMLEMLLGRVYWMRQKSFGRINRMAPIKWIRSANCHRSDTKHFAIAVAILAHYLCNLVGGIAGSDNGAELVEK